MATATGPGAETPKVGAPMAGVGAIFTGLRVAVSIELQVGRGWNHELSGPPEEASLSVFRIGSTIWPKSQK